MEQCKECEKQLSNRKGLSCHVKMAHGIQFIDYVIKHELNGNTPTCLCGCGKATSFFGGKFMTYKDHHQPGPQHGVESRRKIGEASKGRIHSAESNIKRSIATTQYHSAHPELAAATSKRMIGRVVTQETKDRMGVTRSAKLASGEIVINRDAISKTLAQKYVHGTWNFARGTHLSPKTGRSSYFRSSYEKQLMQELDVDANVIDWESEFTSIPYEFNGTYHRYIPDFHVVRRSGHSLIEVKPQALRNIPRNEAKRIAAQRYCSERGWVYMEWEPDHS